MYDKFQITTNDFSVNSDHHLLIKQAPLFRGLKQGQKLLFRTKGKNGFAVYGTDAIYGKGQRKDGEYENFTLRISAPPNTNPKHQQIYLSIIFNPSKFNTDNNIYLANNTRLQIAIDGIKKELKIIGVNFNMATAKVSRVDITKDRTMEFSSNQYTQVLSMLPTSTRMVDRNYPNGYQQGNKSWQTVFYGKTEQVKDIYNIDLNKPVMRGELKLLKGSIVERETGFTRLKEFTNRDNYQYLKTEVYPTLFTKNIFTISDTLKKYQGLNTPNVVEQVGHYLSNGMSLNKAITTIMNQIALSSLIDGFGSVDRMLKELTPEIEKRYNQPRQIISRERKKLNKELEILRFADTNKLSGSTTPRGLYQELQEKFLEVA